MGGSRKPVAGPSGAVIKDLGDLPYRRPGGGRRAWPCATARCAQGDVGRVLTRYGAAGAPRWSGSCRPQVATWPASSTGSRGAVSYAYPRGFDPALEQLSVGSLLVAEALAMAVSEGRRTFDFLRGGEPHKYRWGAVDHPTFRRLIRRR